MGGHFLPQRIFPTQGSNPHLLCPLHCRRILCLLNHWVSSYFISRARKVINSHLRLLRYKLLSELLRVGHGLPILNSHSWEFWVQPLTSFFSTLSPLFRWVPLFRRKLFEFSTFSLKIYQETFEPNFTICTDQLTLVNQVTMPVMLMHMVAFCGK